MIKPESGDDIPVKMLDCDSITQAKEKVLDALYKNCPASKRPQLTEVDLSKSTLFHISTGTNIQCVYIHVQIYSAEHAHM